MTEINKAIKPNITRRRDLLPIWIKIFLWLFIVFGGLAAIGFVLGLLGIAFNLSLYGLETNQPISVLGIILLLIFLFKLFVAVNLWTETDYAIVYSKVDAYIGIASCLFVMVVYPFLNYDGNFILSFRLELLALIPFLIKLNRISEDWKKFNRD